MAAAVIGLGAATALAQRPGRDRIATHGLFLGVGGGQVTIDSDAMLAPDEGRLAVAGRVGYGFGDYLALVVSGDLARVDLTHESIENEFEFAHIALSARLHPIRAWRRFGPYLEGSWLRYAATTDRTVPPATVATRLTLEGTGAAAGAGLHLFWSRALSLEASASLTDGKLTKATGGGDFDPIPLRSRLFRLGLTWWLGT
ncbi:MAG: hypothetical protein ACT4P6_14365 [Gemmatimonadaceae bacterium]